MAETLCTALQPADQRLTSLSLQPSSARCIQGRCSLAIMTEVCCRFLSCSHEYRLDFSSSSHLGDLRVKQEQKIQSTFYIISNCLRQYKILTFTIQYELGRLQMHIKCRFKISDLSFIIEDYQCIQLIQATSQSSLLSQFVFSLNIELISQLSVYADLHANWGSLSTTKALLDTTYSLK